jgi:glucose/arabinose dehydrogenase
MQTQYIDYDIVPVDNGAREPTGRLFCSLPGSNTGGATIPRGTCMREFATVAEARALAFAPNGDLFVASPSAGAPGGASGGMARIVVLSDDNHDGVAEQSTFLENVSSVQGLGFANGYLFFTMEHALMRVPYADGQRSASGEPETVAPYESVENERWTHGLAVSHGGTLYTSQGVHSALMCPDNARAGSVLSLGASGLDLVAAGLRNPMYMRCHFADEICLAAELGDDGGRQWNAVERLIELRPSTNYGFPCCVTVGASTAYNNGLFNCSGIDPEVASFPLNDTPFGLDWERGLWPMPFRNSIVVALHGSFYSQPQWQGARVVFAATDDQHRPTGEWRDLVRGFAIGGAPLDRPSDVAFAPDGRLFISDDMSGRIWWLAPDTLHSPWM